MNKNLHQNWTSAVRRGVCGRVVETKALALSQSSNFIGGIVLETISSDPRLQVTGERFKEHYCLFVIQS
ncbi:hypothetical protein RRG08_059390 [Elysia crispata]|uniref:Uncharacterized protein n=1 Tax=Elysia crispata TaxID=231223 RepID=A0AAE1AYV0_9GAST|nr:hypothetical protein RRG08_059390 [Elysia crispata]